MSKVGIITIHYGINYGSVLQAYALQDYLVRLNHDVEIINYIPYRYQKDRKFSLKKRGKFSIKEFAYQMLTLQKKKNNLALFDSFLSNHTMIKEEVYSLNELSVNYADYDALIVGSDQVWNSDYNQGIDTAYYLSFASPSTKKIAYAASCGKEDYTCQEWSEINDLLYDFNAISLRESSMVELFRQKGINCEFVCDPVFLLSESDWLRIADSNMQINEDYLLIYCLDSDKEELIRLGKIISKKRGLKTVLVSYYAISPCKEVDYSLEGCSPEMFLHLMKRASFVVTNSFHGTAFSIVFNRQFIVTKRKKYNSRIDSLLNTFDLMERYVDLDEVEILKEDIDYQMVNEIKESFVNQSKQFLKDSIKEGR